MHTAHTQSHRHSRGFTIVELITAMAITAVLVLVIVQLTRQSIDLWKGLQDETNSTSAASLALQTMSRDLESFQMRSGNPNYQWFFAEVDGAMKGQPKGLSVPKSARCIFFVCAPDRNPPVGAKSSSRDSYRNILASNTDTQGDVGTVGYRLMYRDQILNLESKQGDRHMFPLFSLYRQVVNPRETYDYVMGRENLNEAYKRYESDEKKYFLCENIVELSMTFHVEYTTESSAVRGNAPTYESVTVPILSSSARGGERRFRMWGDRAMADGNVLRHARVVSATISMTVLTEEGVALIEQVRHGQRRAPKLEDFFSRYTRSYARSVTMPVPL